MKNFFVLKFRTFNSDALIVYCDYLVSQLLDNKTFPTLQTSILALQANTASFQSLYNISQKGNAAERDARDAQRLVLEDVLRQLILEAQIACAGNEALAKLTGLTMRSELDRARKNKTTGKTSDFVSKEGLFPGSSIVSWTRAENGHCYLIKLSFGDSEVWTDERVTGETSIVIKGLETFVYTRAKICAVNKQGEYGIWSETIRLKIN